ncbi:hypothetical protein EI171_35555 [Bradyrhizobium sp. LCT2]|nr:hypothetical protein EI171_35555 [Bradyrhizobium sp. LCT2]
MRPRAGNRANFRPNEGCRVSSVASREMAAGLSALSAMDLLAREAFPPSRTDRSQRIVRSTLRRFDDGQLSSGAMFAGTAVSTQKHTEIMFRGAAASCYRWLSMGARGVVTNTSRRPN